MTVEELERYGVERMDDSKIQEFLANKSIGVLGLPTDGAPYLVPMSYGFDGESSLYFTFVVGEESQKAELSDAAEEASFLVYAADSMFMWRSVLLNGTLEAVPEESWESIVGISEPRWRPELFVEAGESERVVVYRFEIDSQAGIRHTGLPPGFEDHRSED